MVGDFLITKAVIPGPRRKHKLAESTSTSLTYTHTGSREERCTGDGMYKRKKCENGRDCVLVSQKSVITDWLYEREILSYYTNKKCFPGLNLPLGIMKLSIQKRHAIRLHCIHGRCLWQFWAFKRWMNKSTESKPVTSNITLFTALHWKCATCCMLDGALGMMV